MQTDIKTFGELSFIDTINIDGPIKILNKNKHLWGFNTERQRTPQRIHIPKTFYVHRNTESIVIIWTDNKSPFKKEENKKLFKLFNSFFLELLEILNNKFQFNKPEIIKLVFASLLPNSCIDRHIDQGPVLRTPQRIHIPIITNEDVDSVINDKTFYMAPGHIYNFNNTLPHSIINRSKQKRIHCIIDYCDQDHFQSVLKKHKLPQNFLAK